jgi:large subunit ribosomal protein L28
MAAVCEVCGKHPSFGMSISHSHRRTKRRWNPNIQRVRAVVGGTTKRVHVCTSCLRAGKITKAVRQGGPATQPSAREAQEHSRPLGRRAAVRST